MNTSNYNPLSKERLVSFRRRMGERERENERIVKNQVEVEWTDLTMLRIK